jgi:putative spermidine/putrescine transport system ATP-binding protein
MYHMYNDGGVVECMILCASEISHPEAVKGMVKAAHGNKGAPITLCHLTKHYGPVVAVDRTNLEVQAGEFVTLLGPSGSGKTTTLMMIAGFVTPSSGDVLIGDRSVVALPPFKRNLGVVFQHYSLFPHMNVFQNIAFPLQMRSTPWAEHERRVQKVLEMVRLPGLAERRPRQLSGGQQQRVALARALVFEPSVLLLDEPLGALDFKLRQELQAEIKYLHSELGVTVIAVTHDQGEALNMSDRIVVMHEGVIQQVGTPQELYQRPINVFVANFIGESNLLTGTIVSQQNTRCMVQLADGLMVSGLLRSATGVSSTVTLLVRPESIVLLRDGESFPNAFDGIVEDIAYLGEVSKYRLRLGSATVVTTTWQHRSGLPCFTRGAHARVGWPVEDMIAVG